MGLGMFGCARYRVIGLGLVGLGRWAENLGIGLCVWVYVKRAKGCNRFWVIGLRLGFGFRVLGKG